MLNSGNVEIPGIDTASRGLTPTIMKGIMLTYAIFSKRFILNYLECKESAALDRPPNAVSSDDAIAERKNGVAEASEMVSDLSSFSKK